MPKNRIGFLSLNRYPMHMFATTSMSRIVAASGLSLLMASVGSAQAAGATARLLVPASEQTLSICVPAPEELASAPGSRWQFVESAPNGLTIPVTLAPAPDRSGVASRGWHILANLPPRAGATGERSFLLSRAPHASPAAFQFTAASTNSLCLSEGNRPVLVYNHGILSKAGVPADRTRSTYVHPLFGLDGEVLTDDFPQDHYHHRGLFWAWPHVDVGTNTTISGRSKASSSGSNAGWRGSGPGGAVLGVENGWYVGDRKVMQERVWLRVFPASGGTRAMDVELVLTPRTNR